MQRVAEILIWMRRLGWTHLFPLAVALLRQPAGLLCDEPESHRASENWCLRDALGFHVATLPLLKAALRGKAQLIFRCPVPGGCRHTSARRYLVTLLACKVVLSEVGAPELGSRACPLNIKAKKQPLAYGGQYQTDLGIDHYGL